MIMDGEEVDLPIFDVQRVQLRFDISAEFVAAQVANNVLILALGSGRILRFDLDNAEDIDGGSDQALSWVLADLLPRH